MIGEDAACDCELACRIGLDVFESGVGTPGMNGTDEFSSLEDATNVLLLGPSVDQDVDAGCKDDTIEERL